MAEKPRTYIFHIFRADGKSLMLHPFKTPQKLVSALEQTDVIGRYGGDPRIESLFDFRAEVYRCIDAAVRRWLADVRFIPKFLISSSVFLVLCFFTSYVVRDAIPVAVDFLIPIAAAVLTYAVFGLRDARSGLASHRRVALMGSADRIPFTESGFVKKAEMILHGNESKAVGEVLREIITPSLQELGEEEREEASQFLSLLESRFDSRRFKREERVLRKLASDSGRLSERMKSRDFDLPLYAVYKSLKRSVASSKA